MKRIVISLKTAIRERKTKENVYGSKIHCRLGSGPGKGGSSGCENASVADADALKTAKRALSGSRLSDGFNQLLAKGHLELSLEAIAIDKRYTELFTDEEANEALNRLLEVGYHF